MSFDSLRGALRLLFWAVVYLGTIVTGILAGLMLPPPVPIWVRWAWIAWMLAALFVDARQKGMSSPK